ncbi:TPA: hypothetical protein ACY4SV_002713 [Clostridium perfringens]|nr:hypothetical protein [Clostridium perfringens]HAT4352183.1 hypothetical protein [Clostridium perfringens]
MKKIFLEIFKFLILQVIVGIIANVICGKIFVEEKEPIDNKIEINYYFYNNKEE